MVAVRKQSKKIKNAEVSTAKNDEILKDCVSKTNDWYKYYNEHIERARNYLTFLYVDQWDENIRNERETQSRCTLQFNKLTSIIRSILGDQRVNSPALAVRGRGKNIKHDLVDVYDGLVRQIHYDSDADIVYQIASKSGLECGWGAGRVVAEYENADTFQQCLKILPIYDYQAAFWDPTAQASDKLDGDYCGVYTLMSLEHFKKIYPDIENPQSVSNEGSNYYLRWNTRDTILVAEIYRKEYFTKKIAQLSDGNEVDYDAAQEILAKQEQIIANNPNAEMMGFRPLEIVNEREAQDYKIRHYKFIQHHLLEQADYPGKILPIVYFEGDSTVIDGERIPLPYVQDGIDEQRLINYIGSEIAYAMLRSRKETVMGTAENFAGHEDQWLNPDQVQGALTYNFDKAAGKPDFIDPQPFNQAYIQLYQNASQDLKDIMGWFEDARGAQTNAQSGIAITKRQEASKKPVNIYTDNNSRGMKAIGKILLDMIPHVYDTERTIMVMGKDGESKAIDINKQSGYKMTENGEIEPNIENDMSYGKYDIEISVQGSYDVQMAAAMDTLIRLAQINPAIANLIPDLLAENSGLENSQQLVERLKTLLPPDILAKEEGKPMPPPPPPNPALMIEQKKLELQDKELQNKQQEMAINEQKIMQEAQLAGLSHQTSLAKAQAEIIKSKSQRDIAILNHTTALHNSANKSA